MLFQGPCMTGCVWLARVLADWVTLRAPWGLTLGFVDYLNQDIVDFLDHDKSGQASIAWLLDRHPITPPPPPASGAVMT